MSGPEVNWPGVVRTARRVACDPYSGDACDNCRRCRWGQIDRPSTEALLGALPGIDADEEDD